MASILSYNKGLIDQAALDRIISLIRQFELPHLTEELLDMDKVIAYTKNDKKMQGSSIKFILLNSIGDAFISTEVTDQDMLQAMKDYLALGL
jgi:3-dehydroquinate synthase